MKVLLVDDHELFRRGLRLILRESGVDMDVSEVDSCAQALRLSAEPFDVVLLDMHMPGVAGLDALQTIKHAWPTALVVVVSGEEDPVLIREAIKLGACGFVPKSSSAEVMLQALQLVLARGVYLPPQLLQAPGPDRVQLDARLRQTAEGMTERQAQVLKLALKGAPNKVIGRELGISEGTVKSHLSTVFRLLNVRNRTEALYCAARMGLHV